jgi:predicted nuclease of predicted toxin-antitoxin system
MSQLYRFLVDQTLSPELAPMLRAHGHDVMEVFALHSDGRSREDVFAAAWHERRILVTQDQTLLDYCRPDVNPGVVALPATNGHGLTKALVNALSMVQIGGELSAGAKILVTEDGRFTVTHHGDGADLRETIHYKLRKDGPPLIWTSGKSRGIE